MSAQAQSSEPVDRVSGQVATTRNKRLVSVPVVGVFEVPPTEELVFIGGVGLLTAAGVLEWPVATLLVVGHLLSTNRRLMVLADVGEVLEEA